MTSKHKESAWHMPLAQQLTIAGFVLAISLIGIASWYGYVRLTTLSEQVSQLDTKLDIQIASTTARLTDTLAEATTSLRNAFQRENQNVQEQLGGVRNQVGSITGVVTDLQKLSKIDPELLAKYSKVFFLSDTYAPARLVEIPPQYAYSETKQLQVIPEVLPYLEKMLIQAQTDGIALYVDSAYRSFASQKSLKGQYSVVYGSGTANQFSADQGYSEHQLGTTIDFITTGTGGMLAGFDATPAYTWMTANAYRYGFVLSYPKNNAYYIFEPWHWRFVGVKLATNLHTSNTPFYTLDQRDIDTYLISLFD